MLGPSQEQERMCLYEKENHAHVVRRLGGDPAVRLRCGPDKHPGGDQRQPGHAPGEERPAPGKRLHLPRKIHRGLDRPGGQADHPRGRPGGGRAWNGVAHGHGGAPGVYSGGCGQPAEGLPQGGAAVFPRSNQTGAARAPGLHQFPGLDIRPRKAQRSGIPGSTEKRAECVVHRGNCESPGGEAHSPRFFRFRRPQQYFRNCNSGRDEVGSFYSQ